LESDSSLLQPDRLRERIEALDRLDESFPDVLQSGHLVEGELYPRVRALCARLEALNRNLFEAIRSQIRSGASPEALLRWVDAPAKEGNELARGMGYDHLDELISGVLQLEEPENGQTQEEPEMVFYQPTPARLIFSLISQTALTASDVLVDLGSGLGHVPLLVSICTPAHCIGIELETSYVECAWQCAQSLNLGRAAFLAQDARVADLSRGTVFYLYTPFVGSILRCVLDRLRGEAAARRIRVCTYGPCTSVVAEESWLELAATPATDRIVLFHSRG
jgi:hypothetical protein